MSTPASLTGIVTLAGDAPPPALAAALGGGTPAAVEQAGCALFATGWADVHREPDGLVVAGSAHLVNGAELPPGPKVSHLAHVAAAYRAHGADGFARLEGQFCIAVWDPGSRRVVLAVDRFATQRLFYATTPEAVLFSARLEPLVRALQPRIDPQAILEYLLHAAIPAPRSPFAGITKLPSAHALIADAHGTREQTYWDMTYPEERAGDEGTWAQKLRTGLEAAVRRAVAAEPVPARTGTFLSGGTDSSTVAGFMTAARGGPIDAFSIGYVEEGYDELAYARTAAAWFRAQLHAHRLTPAEAFADLPAIAAYYDEPFGNSSVLPTYRCARLARECGMDALFAGDGGDELFGGNERYRTNAVFGLYQRLPGVVRGVTDLLAAAIPAGIPGLGLIPKYVRRSNIPLPRRFFSYDLLVAEPLDSVLTPDFLASTEPDRLLAVAEEHFQRPPRGTSDLNRLLYLDLKLAIADNDLRKVSGMCELAGVAVRYPLLDARLVELSGRIPTALKLRRLEKRYLFKRALDGFLPPAVLNKTKHGFGTPIAAWMKSDPAWRELIGDLLHDARTRQRGYLQPTVLDRLWTAHGGETSSYYGDTLWPILMLELWHRQCER